MDWAFFKKDLQYIFLNQIVSSIPSWTIIEQLIYRNDLNKEIFNIGPDEEFVTINTLAKTILAARVYVLHDI